MSMHASKEFPGIAFEISSDKPFFKAIVKENLRRLAGLQIGRLLLDSIKKAAPAYRVKEFPHGVNVLIQPPLEKRLAPPGMSHKTGLITDAKKYADFIGGVGQMIPTMPSKTQAQPCNNGAAIGGGGSVCWLFYSNLEMMSSTGEALVPFITMGHELIHCLRALEGRSLPVGDKREEWATVGIKGESYFITENDLRQEAGIALRTKYFAGD